MSISFVFGGSGAGKSTYVYEQVIKGSLEHPEKNYFIIVPDQFTMQTQKEIVEKHPRHGIMNIDVLSFGRLSYRIFEETGDSGIQSVLDDTGKNLILRMVAEHHKEELKVLGGYLKKQGYIHEIKSAISEFMQYGISTGELEQIMEAAKQRTALAGKLADLSVLYREFVNAIRERYITTEETLHILAEKIPESKILKDSTIVFDGFTGFTPVQLLVIGQLLACAEEVCFTVLMDERENPFEASEEHNLFQLSRKTVEALLRTAEKEEVKRGKDVFLPGNPVCRLKNQSALAHLEHNLFRYPQKEYMGIPDGIEMAKLSGPGQEAKYVARSIRKLIREKGYQYRDIAVVCGNLDGYSSQIRNEFTKMNIPFFLDQNTGILLNPFIEFIRSSLLIVGQDFSVDSVNHYLRTGLTDLTEDEIDMLDNYILETGIRGRSRWSKPFTYLPSGVDSPAEQLVLLNQLREKMMAPFEGLCATGKRASERVKALYAFIVESNIQEKLVTYETMFREKGDLARAKQYQQIYPYVMDLLSQIHDLLGEEALTEKEFRDLLDAGFSEMQVGIIPQNVDHIVVGDIERTRLKDIKVLFFMGINDGNIPKSASMGGIISDIDREFLQTLPWEFAPSPRQKMYIQRLYLYMNMTKPSERLYLSFCATAADGSTLRPAYLIEMLKKLYPNLTIRTPEEEDTFLQLEGYQDSYDYLAGKLREFAEGKVQGDEYRRLTAFVAFMQKKAETRGETSVLLNQASLRYQEKDLPAAIALQLYGKKLVGSVTRLETFASCAYEHFLKYGLKLQDRKEFGFEALDMGNIFHSVLADFSEKLPEHGYTWFDFPKEVGEKILDQVLENNSAAYGNAVLYENARSRYAIERIRRILSRTVGTIQYQLQQGSFEPKYFEMGFQRVERLDDIDISMNNGQAGAVGSGQAQAGVVSSAQGREGTTSGVQGKQMQLVGKIDRLDICEEDNTCYIKVVDYKSGTQKFDLVAVYHGLQLQLITYLNGALETDEIKKKGKNVVPAGVLYYHLDDPMVETDVDLTPEQINHELIKQLRLSGLVDEREDIIRKIDHTPGGTLEVLPLTRKKDGTFQKNSILMPGDQIRTVSEYVNGLIRHLGTDILHGKKDKRPYKRGDQTACTYCPYHNVCHFDAKVPGYQFQTIQEKSRDEILGCMKKDEKGHIDEGCMKEEYMEKGHMDEQ